MWLQEISEDYAHTLFDGKEDTRSESLNHKDFVEQTEQEKKQIIQQLKDLKNDLLGNEGTYPDFIKTLAQQKRKATTGNPLGGIPPEIANIWNDTSNPKAPNPLLTKIDAYMQTDEFKQDCIKDFLRYITPSITDFVYLIKGIGTDNLSRLDELAGQPGLTNLLIKKLDTPANLQILTARGTNEPYATIMKWIQTKGKHEGKSGPSTEGSSTKIDSGITNSIKTTETTKEEPSFNDKIKHGLAAMYGPTVGGMPYLARKNSEKIEIDTQNNIVRLLITDPSQNNRSITISLRLDDNSRAFGSIPAQYVKIGPKEYVWTGEKFVSYYEENERKLFNTLDNRINKSSGLQSSNLSEQGGYAGFKTKNVTDRWKTQEIKNHNEPLEQINDIRKSPSLSQTIIMPTAGRIESTTIKKVGKNGDYWTDPNLRGLSSLGIGIDISKEPKTYNPITIDGKIYTPVEVTIRHIASNQKINDQDTQTVTLLMAPNGDILQSQNLRSQKKKIQQATGTSNGDNNTNQRELSKNNLTNYGQIPINDNEFYALAQSSYGTTLSRQSFQK